MCAWFDPFSPSIDAETVSLSVTLKNIMNDDKRISGVTAVSPKINAITKEGASWNGK